MEENGIRKLKVYRSARSISKGKTPSIRLNGKWLQRYGFNIGDYITVECKADEIIIRKDSKRMAEETAAKRQYTDMLSKMSRKEIDTLAESIEEYRR